MSPIQFCQSIQHTIVGTSIRSSTWLFPTIESMHIVGLALVIGSVMWFDFRLLGFTRKAAVAEVAKSVMPLSWWGFSIAAVTGLLLFASEAAMCYVNIAFRLKMLSLLLLGVNALCYHRLTQKKVEEWSVPNTTPFSAKLTGVVSLSLWCVVIVAGRWIAYVGNM